MQEFYVYVYVYRDPSRKNEPIYVGKGFGNRAYIHLDGGSHSVLVNRRLAKMKMNGIEPIINVVDMPSEALALLCEVNTIARFGRKDLKLGPLLNQTDGGEGVSNPSAKTRAILSEASRNPSLETLQKRSAALRGRPKSAKTCQRMSMSRTGIKHDRAICPHCGKEGGARALKRWHFDNCKYRK